MRTRLIGILTLIALVCLIAGLTGCKQKETAAPEPNTPAPAKTEVEPAKTEVEPVTPTVATPPEPAADDVLVTVNGVDITQKQLDALIKPHLEGLAKMAANLPPGFFEQRKKELKRRALEEMVRMQLLNEKVKEANITISDEEIDEEIKRVASRQKTPLTIEQFKQMAKERGYDIEQIKSQMKTLLGHNKLMVKEFPDKVKFTEEDAKTYYEANKVRYEIPEKVRASHILIIPAPSDPNSDPNDAKAAAKAKTEDLLKQIKEGADFAALAKEHSQDPQSAIRGGDLDFFPRGQMVPQFEKAAFDLKEAGDLSEIVETDYGFHIIRLTGRQEAGTTSFEDAKDRIVDEQSQRKLREAAMEYVQTLMKDANIVYAPGMEPAPPAPPQMPGGTVVPK